MLTRGFRERHHQDGIRLHLVFHAGQFSDVAQRFGHWHIPQIKSDLSRDRSVARAEDDVHSLFLSDFFLSIEVLTLYPQKLNCFLKRSARESDRREDNTIHLVLDVSRWLGAGAEVSGDLETGHRNFAFPLFIHVREHLRTGVVSGSIIILTPCLLRTLHSATSRLVVGVLTQNLLILDDRLIEVANFAIAVGFFQTPLDLSHHGNVLGSQCARVAVWVIQFLHEFISSLVLRIEGKRSGQQLPGLWISTIFGPLPGQSHCTIRILCLSQITPGLGHRCVRQGIDCSFVLAEGGLVIAFSVGFVAALHCLSGIFLTSKPPCDLAFCDARNTTSACA